MNCEKSVRQIITNLQRLSNQRSDFTVLGILLPANLELDNSARVPQDARSVRLRDPDQALPINLDDLVVDVDP